MLPVPSIAIPYGVDSVPFPVLVTATVKSLGADLYGLRLFFGPGYRVYFGEHLGRLILILHGGDKSSQTRDIKRAKDYWKTYLEDHT